jgi:hypothetical protein
MHPSLDDPRWKELHGGYRVPFDASVPLRRMEAGEEVWAELWDGLHHQGDVGIASYAAVPHLVRLAGQQRDWNLYALVGVIEVERHRKGNPAVPDWLLADYEQAWRDLTVLALRDLAGPCDSSLVQSALSVLALSKGLTQFGAVLLHLDESEIRELAEERLGWSELYRP